MTEFHDDDYRPETLAELIERLRREPPRPGFPNKTIEELMAEQGVGPIDFDELMKNSPGPFYDGFREDIRRIRRGLPPLGPKNGMRPVHPGEVLREDFLVPAGLTANALAKALRVPAPRVNDIVRERRGITADTAMRLARYFGGDAHSWLNLQAIYDLRVAEIANARKIEREVMPIAV